MQRFESPARPSRLDLPNLKSRSVQAMFKTLLDRLQTALDRRLLRRSCLVTGLMRAIARNICVVKKSVATCDDAIVTWPNSNFAQDGLVIGNLLSFNSYCLFGFLNALGAFNLVVFFHFARPGRLARPFFISSGQCSNGNLPGSLSNKSSCVQEPSLLYAPSA